jgi:hypothetical protein
VERKESVQTNRTAGKNTRPGVLQKRLTFGKVTGKSLSAKIPRFFKGLLKETFRNNLTDTTPVLVPVAEGLWLSIYGWIWVHLHKVIQAFQTVQISTGADHTFTGQTKVLICPN